MAINDRIADMLTRIRNATNAKFEQVAVPYTRSNEAIARILQSEGFLKNVETVGEGWRKELVIALKYTEEGRPIFTELKRTSKLSRRIYVGTRNIRPSRQGMGVAILSTSKGIMKDDDAKRAGLGGEVLVNVW